MNQIEVLHGFTHVRGLGGVQSMLRVHASGDGDHGVVSSILGYFEPADADAVQVRGLGLKWHSTLRLARRRFRECRFGSPAVFVYHNCWGIPFFFDLDRASRRVGVLHTDTPDMEMILEGIRGLVDGLLYVSPTLGAKIHHCCQWLPEERTSLLPYPIQGGVAPRQRARNSSRLVVGYAGRVCRAQKRVDRIPRVLDELRRRGVDCQFEILGDGPDLVWLRRKLGAESSVVFHGRLEGAAYWEVLNSWDVILFVSEYEGLPIALLEAMSVGVLPVYPLIGSGGDGYANAVWEPLVYRSGDLGAAADALRQVGRLTGERVQELRERARAVVQPHLGVGSYLSAFSSFVQKVAALPRFSEGQGVARGGALSDHLPFAVSSRVARETLLKRP